MRLFTYNPSTLRLSKTWLDAFVVKETKKAEQMVQEAQAIETYDFAVRQAYSHVPYTVFTRENIGRTEEEAQQIREIHEELEKVAFFPAFSFV